MLVHLSSYRWGEGFGEHVLTRCRGARAVVIGNALDLIAPESRRAYRERVHDPVQDLRDWGVEAVELDLRDYFGGAGLEEALAGVRLIWCTGGNSFLLRRGMRQSGFDGALARRRGEADLVFGGWSAGAVIAGPSLHGMELMDDPDEVAEGYDPACVWEGLGLVDFAIVPHFGSDHPEGEAAARTQEHMKARGIRHRTLRDGEALALTV